MRILSVTESYAPFWEFGGPPVKVGALARGLAKRGHIVTVLTADWGLAERASAADLSAAERSPFGWRQTEDGVTATYLPTWLRYRSLSWNPAVKRFCKTQLQDYDVAHVYGIYDFLGPAVAAACKTKGIPYVLEPIGMYVPIVRSFFLKRIYHSLYGRRLFEGARKVVATSEQEVEELVRGEVDRSKIVLRRNGVEAPGSWPKQGAFRNKLGIAREAKLILFLGRLSEKKSPDLLLRAFASMAKPDGGEQLCLVFAGPDESGMEARLEQITADLGVTARVQFCGAVFGEEKWAAYRDADVFVLPSQNENFGNTAAESVVAGTPVVVTEACGIAPLLAGRAGLATVHEAGALAAAIRRVIFEPELRKQLVTGCAAVASELAWEEPVLQAESLYNKLALQEASEAKS
jgi:glycosyltransferase involved in cell wall biosynthesis